MNFRDEYMKEYRELGDKMFSTCYIPNVGDFAKAFGKDNDENAKQKIKEITDFTGNYDDIVESCKRTGVNYTEQESTKFINSVIAANVTEIKSSGMLYKYAMSATDNMEIVSNDCKSKGEEYILPIDEDSFNFYIKNRFVMEFDDYIEDYNEFLEKSKNMPSIFVRNMLYCNQDKNHKQFCKKCAGIFRREKETDFVPKYIGPYSTLMVTEKATQASLDSMNKGTQDSVIQILNKPIDGKFSYEQARDEIRSIVKSIGHETGVESRFYEVVLLGRFYKNSFAPLHTSFLRQGDSFGAFIYRPKLGIEKLVRDGETDLTSVKSRLVFNNFIEQKE